FYDEAFADYNDIVTIGKDGQTWMYKEWFSFAALIGFVLLFGPVISLLSTLPFFNSIYTKVPSPLPEPKTNGAKLTSFLIIIFAGLFPALFFPALYSGNVDAMRLLRQFSMVVIAVSAIVLIYSFIKNSERSVKSISFIMLGLGVIQYIYFRKQSDFLLTTEYFAAPT
ncbi:hypothetical protein R0J90_11840, partial [Micrococcus sp. SIMBA_144]